MKKLLVGTVKKYDIIIHNGIINSCGQYIKQAAKGRRVLVVTDSNVEKLYSNAVLTSLKNCGFETGLFVFEAGEQSKNLTTIEKMLDSMCEFGLTRSDLVVALGGGVCGDLAGFAAAIYLRGIDFVQIPTTLLSQIDSSVGGKTGCDLKAGKNLAGAFHNPILVLIDPETLNTLPPRFFNDGMAEAVKYGCIKSEKLFGKLETQNPKAFLPELIKECIEIKKDIVERDFKESGERMLLNFGHTLGHAIEGYYNYQHITHGEAVSIGMAMVTNAAESQGLCKPGSFNRLKACLEKYSLPVETAVPLKDLINFCLSDKKRRGDSINLVLIKEIGQSCIHTIKADQLYNFLKGGANG